MRASTAALIASVRANSRIRLLTGTYAAGYYADHWVALVAPECLVKVRARSVIIAQGAYEQPAVFRGNDLPGVMLASAAQRSSISTRSRRCAPHRRADGERAGLRRRARRAGPRRRRWRRWLDLRQRPGPLVADGRSAARRARRSDLTAACAADRSRSADRAVSSGASCSSRRRAGRSRPAGSRCSSGRRRVDERRICARQCAAASGGRAHGL